MPKRHIDIEKDQCNITPLLADAILNSDFNISELKLIFIYAAKINSHKIDKTRSAEFTKKEWEKVIGADRVKDNMAISYLKNLMSKTIEINDREPTILLRLFDEAFLDRNRKVIQMCCSDDAQMLFFTVPGDNFIYFGVKLKEVALLKSKHSILLYVLLRKAFRKFGKNLDGNSVEITLDEIREKLHIKGKYPSYKELNRSVIKPALNEINSLSDFTIDYEVAEVRDQEKPNKKRFATSAYSIKFTYHVKPKDTPQKDSADNTKT